MNNSNELTILNPDNVAIQYLSKKDKRLAKLFSMIGPISYVPQNNGYTFLVHEIIEQMLSVKAGQQIYQRLSDLCNGDVTPENIAKLSKDTLRTTGTSTAKAEYILNLTNAVLSDSISLDVLSSLSDSDVIKVLTSLKGIGNWTAKMYLIFVLNRPNILPFEDVAFLQTYKWIYKTEDCSPKSIQKKCKKWSPYSSIAARYFYRALDLGYTKNDFHLYK